MTFIEYLLCAKCCEYFTCVTGYLCRSYEIFFCVTEQLNSKCNEPLLCARLKYDKELTREKSQILNYLLRHNKRP